MVEAIHPNVKENIPDADRKEAILGKRKRVPTEVDSEKRAKLVEEEDKKALDALPRAARYERSFMHKD